MRAKRRALAESRLRDRPGPPGSSAGATEGAFLGDVVSERVVKYTGGALFILFAVATALDIQ